MRNEKLLKTALGLLPKLIYKDITPVNMTECKYLSKGDSIIIDFGDHQVGRLAFDLKSVGSHADKCFMD